MTTPYADLERRLREATGGSRELDALIFEATTGASATHGAVGYSGQGVRRTISGLPSYTTSIDSALSLVQDEDGYSLIKFESGGFQFETSSDGWPYHAPTAPLAICIAAIRARSVIAGSK